MDKNIAKKIDVLRNLINKYNDAYYNEQTSLIEDYEYDNLFYELKKLEDKYPNYKPNNNLTSKVSGKVSKGFSEHVHKYRLYSLDNANNEEELEKWDKRVKKEIINDNSLEYVCELKIDGLACALTYKNGELFVGATRGDGFIGENITDNLRYVNGIPVTLNKKIDIDVRGEVYMPISSFEALNKENEKNNEKIFANPRNAASGSLRLIDSSITKNRKLYFFAYNLIMEGPEAKKTHFESLKFLEELGFNVNPNYKLAKNIDEVESFCSKWEDQRFSLDYATDGVVVKVNDIKIQEEIGYTSRAPKWAIAFKFPPEKIWTILEAIEYSVGKSGAITPIAIMKPVSLGGTIVKRASLHNFDEIERLDLCLGDKILVKKAAEIIPKIVDAKHIDSENKDKKCNTIAPPKVCPSCSAKVYRPENEVNYYCDNNDICPAQIKAKLEFFASKDGMDIEGFGPSIIEQLYYLNLVKNYDDFYKLEEKDFLKLKLIKEKSASNLYKALNDSKTRPLNRLLTALGIKHVGKETSVLICEKFNTLDKIINAKKEDFANVEGIGNRIADSIYNYFQNEENIKIIKSLIEHGVDLKNEEKILKADIFNGKTFVITGTLQKTRSYYEKIIKDYGGKVTTSVSKNTSFLLSGENPGSKYDKAKNFHVTILNENDLWQLIGEMDEKI